MQLKNDWSFEKKPDTTHVSID